MRLVFKLVIKFMLAVKLRNKKMFQHLRYHPAYYLFIMQLEYGTRILTTRMVLNGIKYSYCRNLYFLFIFPFVFLYKYLFRLFFFYFDVFGLISFGMFYIYNVLFKLYSLFSYKLYYYLAKLLLRFKNFVAYVTFFDFLFMTVETIYSILPKSFYFHDNFIFEDAYPVLYHP